MMDFIKVAGFVGGGIAAAIIIAVLLKTNQKIAEENKSGIHTGTIPDSKEFDQLTIEEITDWFDVNDGNGKFSHMLLYSTEGQVASNLDTGFQGVLDKLKKEAGLFKNSNDFIAQVIYDDENSRIVKYRLLFFQSIHKDLDEIFENADFYRKQIIKITN